MKTSLIVIFAQVQFLTMAFGSRIPQIETLTSTDPGSNMDGWVGMDICK